MADFSATDITSDAPVTIVIVSTIENDDFLTSRLLGAGYFYKMRALRDPLGTGFVSWTVATNPDPLGTQAPETIIPGSAVIMASWVG